METHGLDRGFEIMNDRFRKYREDMKPVNFRQMLKGPEGSTRRQPYFKVVLMQERYNTVRTNMAYRPLVHHFKKGNINQITNPDRFETK